MGFMFSRDTNSNITKDEKTRILHGEMDQDGNGVVTKEELYQYFKSLETKIDQNQDEIVTQDELRKYVSNQLDHKDIEIQTWKQKYSEMETRCELLEEKYNSVILNGEPPELDESFVSSKALKDYIKHELINSDANIKGLPDFIEKRAYFSVYKAMMEAIEKISNTTKIEILNHQFTFRVKPLEKYSVKQSK